MRLHVCDYERGEQCVCGGEGEEGGGGVVGMSREATAQSENGGGGSDSLIGCELGENMKPGSLMNLRG